MSLNRFDCERPAPSLCLMGLTEAELSAIARDGIQLTERNEMMTGMKTYMVAAAVMGLAVMQWFGFEVPAEVWLVLNALGLGFLRSAVGEPKQT
jgi:hypothetical protein